MNRIAYVDGLRAVAVLSVVAYHAAAWANFSAITFPGTVLIYGARGVELFFVISGFCLAYPTLAKYHETGATSFDALTYAAKRVVRIIPPYWLAIVATVIFGVILMRMGISLPRAMHAAAFTPFEIVGQAFFMHATSDRFISDPFWTLPIEFSWYFVFPILLWAWMRSPKSFLGIFAVLLFFQFTGALTGGALPLYLPGFALGIVAADLHIRNARLGWLGVAALGASLLLAVETSYGKWSQGWNPSWQLAAFFFMVVAGEFATLRAVLAWRVLAIIGVASYSIYLIHAPVVAFFDELHWNAITAGIFGVAIGFAFWFTAERPFVDTALRGYLVNAIIGILRKSYRGSGNASTSSGQPRGGRRLA